MSDEMETSLAKRQEFVFQTWDTVAAYSWRYYKQQGRGAAIIIFKHEGPNTLGFEYKYGPTSYVDQIVGEFAAELKGAVSDYDPETEVVFLFLYPDGSNTFARVGTPPGRKTPSELGESGHDPQKLTPEQLGMGRN